MVSFSKLYWNKMKRKLMSIWITFKKSNQHFCTFFLPQLRRRFVTQFVHLYSADTFHITFQRVVKDWIESESKIPKFFSLFTHSTIYLTILPCQILFIVVVNVHHHHHFLVWLPSTVSFVWKDEISLSVSILLHAISHRNNCAGLKQCCLGSSLTCDISKE